MVVYKECKKCINTSANPAITFDEKGYCSVCKAYIKKFNKKTLAEEYIFLQTLRGTGTKQYDALVGFSGGKDSTATLFTVKELGFNPLAVTFDLGYYPRHQFIRARRIAAQIGIDYKKIPIQQYIRKIDRKCYEKTAELYDKPITQELKNEFRTLYAEGRKHYSVKSTKVLPFVRTCQLCRRTVIRAYYQEALKHGVRVIILGMNEWAGLTNNTISAIRKLQPYKNKPAVYVVHIPFLLQRKLRDTYKILKKLDWTLPRGEHVVESNANSCLFARAAEHKAARLLGFHPDTTRLAREVTVGFLTKKQARSALAKMHRFKYSVRKVLERAGVILSQATINIKYPRRFTHDQLKEKIQQTSRTINDKTTQSRTT